MQGDGPMEEADYIAQGEAEAQAQGDAEQGEYEDMMAKQEGEAQAEQQKTESLIDKVKLVELKGLLVAQERFADELAKRREAFYEENKVLGDNTKKVAEKIDVLKSDIKCQALDEYTLTKEKKLLGGIGIKVHTELNYDKEKAYDWAVEHKLALKLDDIMFKKIAKNENFKFVEKIDDIRVTFPREIKID